MEYGLGIITGLLISALLLIVDILFKKTVNQKGIVDQVTKSVSGKAEIIEESEELKSWIDKLPKK